MIDIHSHILPGLDDGAKTLDESLAMLRIAVGAGTTDIVATPHANLEFSFDPQLVGRKIAELEAAANGIIRIHRGCDFHLHYDNIQDALTNPTKYAINHKSYVLVEFSEFLIAKSTDDVFYRLRAAGMIPIITHPERNGLLLQQIDRLAGWVANGCRLQVTALSFLGGFGKLPKTFCDELMKRGLVHFVASDAHDTRHRPPRLDDAHRYIAKKFGAARADQVCVLNPKAALAGDPIDVGDIEELAPSRKWYRFW